MKERPIILTAAEVRAILEGRQTVVWRKVEPQPYSARPGLQAWLEEVSDGAISCPYPVGSRLYVKEDWHTDTLDRAAARAQHEDMLSASPIFYCADNHPPAAGFVWRAASRMPRWASRLSLEVVSVRALRPEDATDADAKAAGARLPERTATLYDGIYVDALGLAPAWYWAVEVKKK